MDGEQWKCESASTFIRGQFGMVSLVWFGHIRSLVTLIRKFREFLIGSDGLGAAS